MAAHSRAPHYHAESGWGDCECFRNAATLALRKTGIYTYVPKGHAVDRWIALYTLAHAWRIPSDISSSSVRRGMRPPNTSAYAFDTMIRARCSKDGRDYRPIDNPEMGFPLVTGTDSVDGAVIHRPEESACR